MFKRASVCFILLVGLLSSCGSKPENERNILERYVVLDSIHNAEEFIPRLNYPSIAIFKDSLPFIRPGLKLEDLPSWFDYDIEPNLDFCQYPDVVTNYMSSDEALSVALEDGSVDGAMFFSASKKDRRVFNISTTWSFNVPDNPKSQQLAMDALCAQLMIHMKGFPQFEDGWFFELDDRGFTERYEMHAPEDGQLWHLEHRVILN